MMNDRMICENCIHDKACHIKHRGSEVCAFFDDRALWVRFSPVTNARRNGNDTIKSDESSKDYSSPDEARRNGEVKK